MFGRCALRLRQCIHFVRKRGVLSRRSAAGSGTLVARHRQVHAPCEAETGNDHKRRSAKRAHRCGVLGYKGARRKRLAQRNAFIPPCPANHARPRTPRSLSAYFSNPQVTCNEISRRPSPFCSATYKMLFPQLLCFENDPSFMGGTTTPGSSIIRPRICMEPRGSPSVLIFTS